MKKIASLMLFGFALLACDAKQSAPLATEKKAVETPSFGRRATANNWPASAQNIVLSQNLTAANYYVVFDGSGSMADTACGSGGRKIVIAKQALKHFIQKVPEGANIGLYVFDDRGTREVATLGSDRETIIRKIDEVKASGSTPLGESIEAGNRALTQQAQRQLGYGEYDLVVITDGQADDEGHLNRAVDNVLVGSPIVIHTIGFCIGEGHSLNRKGKTLYYAANSEQELNTGLQQVLAEAPEYIPTTFDGTTTQ